MSPDLRQKLDRVTQTLFAGGVSNPVTYIEQLSYLIYLKMLDEEENQREQEQRLIGDSARRRPLFPGSAQRFRWSQWKFFSGDKLRNFVRDSVFPYLASLLREEPRIAEYFRDAVLEIVDPHVLKQVVDTLDTIEFSRLGTDAKGDIFEYLLSYTQGQETLGQFRTPRQIRQMMVSLVEPDIGDRIFDPCCGTGGFLIEAVEHILAKYSTEPQELPIYGDAWLEKQGLTIRQAKDKWPNLQTFRKGPGERLPDWDTLERSIYGVDVSRQLMRISMMNLVLHGFRNAQVKLGNSISDLGGLSEEDLRRTYQVILSNPPFAGMIPKESIREDLPTKSKKSELLFLALMMKALAPGGRCAVVVPEGLLFGSTSAHIDLRKVLVHDFEILAVISLPAGVFKPYAGVKTSVLVFRRPKEEATRANRPVWFYEITNDGFDPDKVSQGGRIPTPDGNRIPDLLRQWSGYKTSGYTELPGVPSTTLIEAEAPEPTCWWAEPEAIAASDYSLSAGRYKPARAAKKNDEDPVELIESLIAIEKDIGSRLVKLLEEVRG